MARNLKSPVQTQMAVAVHDRTVSSEFHNDRGEGKPGGRRHLFSKVNAGCALGSAYDHGGNVHTVQRKMQLAHNLSSNGGWLARPILSSAVRDQSGPVEIIGSLKSHPHVKHLVGDVARAIMNGIEPVKVPHGLGGAYYFRNSKGENVALVKPADEEPLAPNNPKGMVGKSMGQPGLKRWVRVGETGFREVAAYILDHDRFANVPPTTLVKITHSIFNINDLNSSGIKDGKSLGFSKIASFQQFIPHDFDASDYGASGFPVAAVHRIGILDIRILNTDRHGGNLLVRKIRNAGGGGRFGGSAVELIPIDHGLCLPENLEDPYFEWIHWPQASIPFSDEELEYIAKLDASEDGRLLRAELPMIHESCLRVLTTCTVFLKEAAAFGLCLSEIGEMMSRGREDGPSELEVVCMEARKLVGESQDLPSSPLVRVPEEDQFQFDVDCEDVDIAKVPVMAAPLPPKHGFCTSSYKNPLCKLEETLEEEDDNNDDGDGDYADNDGDSDAKDHGVQEYAPANHLPSIQRLSVSLKGVGLIERKNPNYKAVGGGGSGMRAAHRSADEQLPTSASFVRLADMGNEEWATFLARFQELLPGAFLSRKSTPLEHRLGTSCQF